MSDDLVAWLRRAVKERRALAWNAIVIEGDLHAGDVTIAAEPPACSPGWREQSSGVLVTGEGAEGDAWYGTWAMGDSRLTRLIAVNDPRDTIARCEAELAILDEYEAARKVMGDARDSPEGIGAGVFACVKTLNRAISLIGYGYRFWDGYDERAWKP